MTSATPRTESAGRLPDQRTAVVTGAGGLAGIGRVTARILAENGWHVALIDINAEGLAEVEADLKAAGHGGVISVPTNIASEDSVAEAFARIDNELPPVVALVNLPLGRVGQPLEIGGTVHFLLSDAAAYINGATLQVDGGKHMH